MFLAELLHDLGAGSGAVAECTASDTGLEFLHNPRRKSMRKKRKRLREMNADHFPVSGGCILTRRSQRAFSKCRSGAIYGTDVRQRLQITQAELGHVRQVQLTGAGDVA